MANPALTAKLRLQLLKRVFIEGVPVAKACREFEVSRFTFYKWAKKYDPKLSRKKNLENLRDKKRKIKKFARQTQRQIVEEVKKIIAENPQLSKYKIADKLKEKMGEKAVGVHGVYNVLKRVGLSTYENRKEWQSFVLLNQKRVLTAGQRLEIIRREVKLGVPVARVCRDFGISRQTFYKWKRRWEKEGRRIDALRDRKPNYDREHLRVKPETEKLILSLVVEFPKLSKYGLAQKLAERRGPVTGVHGVYNVLLRNGLNQANARFAYAQVHASDAPSPATWIDRVRYVLEQFIPSLAPAPPPSTAKAMEGKPALIVLWNFFKAFSVSSIFSIAASYSLIWWISLVSSRVGVSVIGLVFASTALLMGSLFFLYSLKYYLTLAIVLSFSQQEAGVQEIGDRRQGRARDYLSWILGLDGDRAKADLTAEASAKAVGLTPNLEHIKLKRYPYISVHIPFYNEKNVVERSIKAATNFDYQGKYEIVLCNDSTDETTQIIENYLKENSSSLSLRENKKEGWRLTSGEVRPGVVVKHIHRTSRSGFKGGALAKALELVHPDTEFICVFDADFVPYPDTLELFLKYFQATTGTLSFGQTPHKIAVVQGYQWHVLNKSENWITRGIRSEYAGSYVIERSGTEIYGGLKMISGAVYMIRRDVLEEVGWETSITEDFQLTLKLYEKGYKVVYTPYIQAPAECVSTLKRLIRQRMRWAEGHSNNIRKMFVRLLFGRWEEKEKVSRAAQGSREGKVRGSSKVFIPSPLTSSEKLEFLYLAPYYLQAFFFLVGTLSWLISETLFPSRLPFWTQLWGWSLVLTNMLSLPLMNAVGLFLEESEEKDYSGLASFIALSYIMVPFQAYASVKGFLKGEGPWFRTPKTGKITDVLTRGTFYRFISGILPGRITPALRIQTNEK